MKKIYLAFTRQKGLPRGIGRRLPERIVLSIIFLVLSHNLLGQHVRVTGTVTDEKGLPLPGVSVMVQGSHAGVSTDSEGKYSIPVTAESVLEFKFIGYSDQIVPVHNRSVVDIRLAEESEDIDEVVVVGYGTVRKRDLTGAVASVGADKIRDRPYSNVMQSLAGQLPGVQITTTQGSPGYAPNIKVRGASTINAGSTPLYVIDGIPLEDESNSSSSDSDLKSNVNPLNYINPNDIESIEILKDASSAAIYGSRGANGVVLITTKQGKAGQTRIEAGHEIGISTVSRKTEVMNAVEWMEWETAARVNSVRTDPTLANDLQKGVVPAEFSDPAWLARIGNGTDWQDVLFRTGISHNFRASVSGGNDKTQFMVSAGYLDSEGVVDKSYYDRITVRSNLRHKISDKFNVGMNISLARVSEASFGTAGKSDVVSLAVQSDPIFPVYNEVGTLGFKDPNSIWNTFQDYGFQLWHPYSLTREMDKKKITNNAMAVAFIEWNIIDGLTFKTSLSGTMDDSHYNSYWNEGQNWGYSMWVPAEANYNTAQTFNWIWENTLNYNKAFGNHYVTGLLGYTAQEQRFDDSQMKAGNFPNDLVHTLNAGTVTSGKTSASEWSMISYLARGTYSYKGKYLVSAAIRADGSSRFSAGNRWGYFPSASFGWRLSEENFMLGASRWLDNLKFRVSYGVTGNNRISDYASIKTLGYYQYVIDGSSSSGLRVNSFPDEDIKWEKTKQVNIGLDMAFFNQRINVTYDYYYSKTVDMLLEVGILPMTGFTSSLTNVGELQNQGMELNISTRNLMGRFQWTTDFNISGNRNKVLKLGTDNSPILDNVNSALILTEVGQPIGNYYGYLIDGVIMTAADLNRYPVWPGSEAGDPKVADVDKSGTITAEDRTILGNCQPDFTWGMTNTFMRKGVELSFMLQGVHGNEIMNQQARYNKEYNGARNAYKLNTNFWRSEENPGDGKIAKPRVVANTVQGQSSSYWVEDGSFVRIKNLRLGYTLPARITQRWGVNSLKVYINVENLHVFSDYPNFDSEGSTFLNGRFLGLDYGTYPNPRTWTMGVNLSF